MSFFNLYRHNFARVAVCLPEVRVADPTFNAGKTIALLEEASRRRAILALFPELGVSAYSCEDLFHQQALLDGTVAALEKIVAASREIPVIAVVGAPLVVDNLLLRPLPSSSRRRNISFWRRSASLRRRAWGPARQSRRS